MNIVSRGRISSGGIMAALRYAALPKKADFR
jgi:hypothetical protein